MKTLSVSFIALFLTCQVSWADYVLTSGGNDTGANSGQSIVRYTDGFQIVWERSPAQGTGETEVSAVEINPDNGDVYTGHVATPVVAKHLQYADGSYIGRPVPASGKTAGGGVYTAPNEAVQDLQFGYDYNRDGVADLWVCRRDTFEVYDGTTLNRKGDGGAATLLVALKVADSGGASGVQDGTGGYGITFGPDLTGDGVGELYALAGVNAANGTRLNVWNPVTMTQVATYNADGTKDNCLIVLGPDVNGDGRQDLWITDPRHHRLRAYDGATGALVAGSINLVQADAPGTAVTLRAPTDIDYGPEGTLLVTTRFATSVDPQWVGPKDTGGGDLLQIRWDPASKTGLVTLLFEYAKRLDGVAYVAPEPRGALAPHPAPQAADVPPDVILGWKPGTWAAQHDVYFGDSPEAVAAASRTSPLGVLVSQAQDANAYDPAGPLELGKTYYWRVDEVNAPPDATIFPGTVWSFTVEPVTSPLANVTATASSCQAGMGPERTVDGSGLNASDQHSAQSTDMWLSDLTGPQPTWIQFGFDTAQKLTEMWVWNSNQYIEGSFGLGLKAVQVEYSTSGNDWTALAGAPQFARAPGTDAYAPNITVDFQGVPAQYVRITAQSNWGGLVPQYGLSEVRFFSIPVQAREPHPAPGEEAVALDTPLSWRPGRGAALHRIYLSTSRSAVANGTAPTVTTDLSRYRPTIVEFGRTYWWRVDEVNEAGSPQIWEGPVWSFSTTEYGVVDNFESYTDQPGNSIFDFWTDGIADGNGSIVGHYPDAVKGTFCETTVTRNGRQSMPLQYNNVDKPYYSEARRTFDAPQDWTMGAPSTLSLYVRGPADVPATNVPLYVMVEDQAGHSKVVAHSNPQTAVTTSWQQWRISLSTFRSAGVDLAAVKKLIIGVGNRNNPKPGGEGKLYIDDIGVGHPAH